MALGVYVIGKIFLYFIRQRKRREFFDEAKYGKTRSFEMMIDEEKILTEQNGIQATMPMEEIVDVAEFRGYIMVKNGPKMQIILPKEQLLDDELNLLDEVKRKLRGRKKGQTQKG